ncbi:hypothetical protein ACJ41P_10310 [Azospirillum argentinense]|uniref:DUF559 domain-containing protein n=1 Tax=Azospirillum argentinense TaxID=2970906 RepID=A0ABW8V4T6_9PROT
MGYAEFYAAEKAIAKDFAAHRLLDGIGFRFKAIRVRGLYAEHLEACIDAATDVLMERGVCAGVLSFFKEGA